MRLSSSSGALTLLSVGLFYLLAICFVRINSHRDPTSLFFDPRQAYIPKYSTVRQHEAEAFIAAAANARTTVLAEKPVSALHDKKLCVGISSVARQDARYLRTTVGSLLEGLSAKERDGVYLLLFIAHTDPTVHPAYSETWLSNLSDEVLLYNLSQDQMAHVTHLEHDGGSFREKGLFDYTYLLKACYERRIPYIAMLEDDIVAMDGWYHTTIAGVKQAEAGSVLKAASCVLYLRLFYTEEFLGWNREDWKTYLSLSMLCVIVPVAFFAWIRSFFSLLKTLLSNRVILAVCGVYIPLLIALFFAAGRVTVRPLPAGVNAMDKYGCCSQGLVFPRDKAGELIDWYESKKVGFVDTLTEEYADQRGELRWALTPSVIQHVGRKSSKGDDYGAASKYDMTVAEKMWNFAFEQNSATALREKHSEYITKND